MGRIVSVLRIAILLALVLYPCIGSAAPNQLPFVLQVGLHNQPQSMAISPDRTILVTTAYAQFVYVWDARNGTLIHSFAQSADHVAISADSKTIALEGIQFGSTGDDDDKVTLYDRSTWKIEHAMSVPCGASNRSLMPGLDNMAFSPDRRILATARDGVVTLFDYHTGLPLRSITLNTNGFSNINLAFSPNGSVLATGESTFPYFSGGSITISSKLDIWDVSTCKSQATIDLPGSLYSATFSPNGKYIAVGTMDMSGSDVQVDIWNIASHKNVKSIGSIGSETSFEGMQTYPVNNAAIAFSPDGKRITAANETGDFRRWDVETGELLAHGGKGEIGGIVTVSPDGRLVATSAGGGVLNLYDADGGTLVFRIPGNPVALNSLAFSNDGCTLYQAGTLSYGTDESTNIGQLLAWDARIGEITNFVPTDNRTDDNNIIQQVNNDSIIITDSMEGLRDSAWLIGKNAAEGRKVDSIDNSPENFQTWDIGSTALSHDGTLLAVSSSRGITTFVGRLEIWNARTGRKVLTLPTHNAVCSALQFSEDGKSLISVMNKDRASTLDIWDLKTASIVRSFPIHGRQGYVDRISPNGHWVISEDAEYDVRTGQLMGHLSVPGYNKNNAQFTEISNLVFSEDSTRIAWYAGFGAVHVIDSATLHPIQSWSGLEGYYALALSPDGQLLACVDTNGFVDILDVATGKLRATMAAFGQTSDSGPKLDWIAYTPDGYFDGSPGIESLLRWPSATSPASAAKMVAKYHRPDLLQIALTGKVQPDAYAASSRKSQTALSRAQRDIARIETQYNSR